jgi:hypothetical protein
VGYSGLIYAAIVAGWAAVLVPRWIRRNDEIERAREADAQRGVRVLERRDGHVRGGRVSVRAHTLGESTYQRGNQTRSENTAAAAPATNESTEFEVPTDRARVEFGRAARRRRRVLALLTLSLAVVVGAAVTGLIGSPWIGVPSLLLAAFVVLARRAAITESRRRSMVARQLARQRDEAPTSSDASAKRVAVYEPPPPLPAPDPDAWEPVPVPLPTYLTKAKAKPAATRTIDLSSPGAWTSGRLNPASSITLPPERPATSEADLADEYAERRRAVGD